MKTFCLSNHSTLLVDGRPHPFQSFVHGPAVEGKNVHVLLHLRLRLPLPLALLHHTLQPLSYLAPRWTGLGHGPGRSLLFGRGGRGSVGLGVRPAHLEVVLALLQHAHVLPLRVEVERLLLQLFLQALLQFLVLDGFFAQPQPLAPFEHFRLDVVEDVGGAGRVRGGVQFEVNGQFAALLLPFVTRHLLQSQPIPTYATSSQVGLHGEVRFDALPRHPHRVEGLLGRLWLLGVGGERLHQRVEVGVVGGLLQVDRLYCGFGLLLQGRGLGEVDGSEVGLGRGLAERVVDQGLSRGGLLLIDCCLVLLNAELFDWLSGLGRRDCAWFAAEYTVALCVLEALNKLHFLQRFERDRCPICSSLIDGRGSPHEGARLLLLRPHLGYGLGEDLLAGQHAAGVGPLRRLVAPLRHVQHRRVFRGEGASEAEPAGLRGGLVSLDEVGHLLIEVGLLGRALHQVQDMSVEIVLDSLGGACFLDILQG